MPTARLEGHSVCGGIVTGRVRIVIDPRDAVSVKPDEIMVVPRSHPEYALGVLQAAGLICEDGGTISHICTVALELGIPCVTEVPNAVEALRGCPRVTLDGDAGVIYRA